MTGLGPGRSVQYPGCSVASTSAILAARVAFGASGAASSTTPKAGRALSTRLDHRNPLVFDTHELGRRPGALQRLTREVAAPADLGIDGVIGVPEGSPVELELRLESVMEGVLVTGTARAAAEGSA